MKNLVSSDKVFTGSIGTFVSPLLLGVLVCDVDCEGTAGDFSGVLFPQSNGDSDTGLIPKSDPAQST